MRLTDIVSGLDLTIFPIVGLVCFLGAFAMIAARVFATSKGEMKSYGHLPLDEDTN